MLFHQSSTIGRIRIFDPCSKSLALHGVTKHFHDVGPIATPAELQVTVRWEACAHRRWPIPNPYDTNFAPQDPALSGSR